MERQFIDRLILIIAQEVNQLLDNDLAELQSITNDYLMNVLFILLIDLYLKLIVVNNWIISLVIITSFSYYLNYKYFRLFFCHKIFVINLTQMFDCHKNLL